jgi:hypothetical protein
MKNQNILALALKPARRVTKSVGIGIVLMLTAALIAMITPSAASGRRPCQPTRHTAGYGPMGPRVRQHRYSDGALTLPKAPWQDLARRSPDREVTMSPAVCRPRSRTWGDHRWGDRRRVHRQHRTHWSPPSALTSVAATLMASPNRRPRQFHRRR